MLSSAFSPHLVFGSFGTTCSNASSAGRCIKTSVLLDHRAEGSRPDCVQLVPCSTRGCAAKLTVTSCPGRERHNFGAGLVSVIMCDARPKLARCRMPCPEARKTLAICWIKTTRIFVGSAGQGAAEMAKLQGFGFEDQEKYMRGASDKLIANLAGNAGSAPNIRQRVP